MLNNKIAKIFSITFGVSLISFIPTSCSIEIDPDPVVGDDLTVRFNVDSSYIVKGDDETIVEKGSYFGQTNAPLVQREDYLFSGWTLTEGSDVEIDPQYVIDDNINVYPIWTPDVDIHTKIIAHDDSYDYECDINSLCDTEGGNIILDPIIEGQGEHHEIARNMFNLPLTVGNSVLHLPDYFMVDCENFTKIIDFENESKLTSIGQSFLNDCPHFDAQFTLPNSLKWIYDDFLGDCSSFNQSIVFPSSLKYIGRDFLSSCTSFNKPITFSETISYVGQNCMFGCDAFCQLLTINMLTINIDDNDNGSWSSEKSDSAIATTGFTVTGNDSTNIDLFLDKFHTLTGPALWRKVTRA